jgi:hypothetical protein
VAAQQYGKYNLTSKPRQKVGVRLWQSYASATWRDAKGWHYQQFNEHDKTFNTQQEATVFGFSIARAWIDKKG